MTEVADRITKLKERKAALLAEIAETKAEAESLKPLLTCLRCGFEWRARSIEHPPNYCSRCHSSGWNRPPKAKNARRPGDSANPRWEGLQPAPAASPVADYLHEIAGKLGDDEATRSALASYQTGMPPLPFVPDPLPLLASQEVFEAPEYDEPQPESFSAPRPVPAAAQDEPDPTCNSDPEPPANAD